MVDIQQVQDILEALLKVLTYSDFFQYPLSKEELHLLLPFSVSENQLLYLLDTLQSEQMINLKDGYYVLEGREEIISTREYREEYSKQHWMIVFDFLQLIKKIPFIKMVAVTGSLAVNNSKDISDIDIFVITESSRVWITRMLLYAVEQIIENRCDNKTHLCLNFIKSMDQLEESSRNSYVARELIQMKPIYGLSTYKQIINENKWISTYLPNFDLEGHITYLKQFFRPLSKLDQHQNLPELYENRDRRPYLLRALENSKFLSPALNIMDYIEFRRATSKIYNNYNLTTETKFSREVYKAHFSNHQSRILKRIHTETGQSKKNRDCLINLH